MNKRRGNNPQNRREETNGRPSRRAGVFRSSASGERRHPAGRASAATLARDIREINITGLNHDGEGVGRLDGVVVFVPGAIPGDIVAARISETRKNLMRGELVEIKSPSADRAEPSCQVSDRCGGCSLLGMTYEAQLRWKTRAVKDALERIGGLGGVVVHPCLGAENPFYYRNKVQFPVAVERGEPVAGCYEKGSHRVVAVDECRIQHPTNNLIVTESLRLIKELGLTVYDEERGGGLIRHIMGRVAPGTGESMAIIVTSIKRFTRGGEFASRLMERVPGVSGVIQNINTERTNIILGPETRVIAGKGTIDDLFGNDSIGRLRFRISPMSFYQVNTAQAANLYAKALEYCDLGPADTAMDLYCGIGSITLFLATRCRGAYGIEEVPEAIKDARQNARLNRIENAEFQAGRAERILPALAAERKMAPSVIVLDPPRKGCEPEVLAAVAHMAPRRIVYVSCYPSTLARDLAVLARSGYRVVAAQPVDMFPETSHVECVVLIERVSGLRVL